MCQGEPKPRPERIGKPKPEAGSQHQERGTLRVWTVCESSIRDHMMAVDRDSPFPGKFWSGTVAEWWEMIDGPKLDPGAAPTKNKGTR